jgi:hypothetical protein
MTEQSSAQSVDPVQFLKDYFIGKRIHPEMSLRGKKPTSYYENCVVLRNAHQTTILPRHAD